MAASFTHLSIVSERADDLAECKERFVDFYSFFQCLLVVRLSVGLPLAASQIHQVQLRYYQVALRRSGVKLGDLQSEDAVRPGARLVEPVSGHHLVFESSPEMLEALFGGEALEIVQIFNHYVILRRPLHF